MAVSNSHYNKPNVAEQRYCSAAISFFVYVVKPHNF